MLELYHVLNRGVEKRNIFDDDRDRARFVHDLFEFNDTRPAGNAYKLFNSHYQNMDIVYPYFDSVSRDCLVDIHGWILMDNHYHLLLSERIDGGLSLFLRKLNVGYAKYYNERYKRSGFLFQGRTKKIRIKTDSHFLHILHYLHLNALDFLTGAKDWRKYHLKNSNVALAHLAKYRWSSYMDYCGQKNFPSLINKNIFSDTFPDYKQTIKKYLQKLEFDDLLPYTLE